MQFLADVFSPRAGYTFDQVMQACRTEGRLSDVENMLFAQRGNTVVPLSDRQGI